MTADRVRMVSTCAAGAFVSAMLLVASASLQWIG
jgi:hypothetical protein